MAEISTIVRAAGETGVRASAVLAASGGLVATFALPAQASVSQGAAAAAVAEQPASAPVAPAAPVSTLTAPALVAPTSAAPVTPVSVGIEGITAVKKPKPKPKPKPTPEPVVEAVAQAPAEAEAPTPPPVANVEQSSSEIVNIARTLLGIPYLYGGTSPSTGFDCSGFTSYVFGQAGISLPRTAADQQAAATPVSDPQPGDLVFFGSPAWHVGIYTGNGMMIDSPKPGSSTSERPVFDGVSGYGRF